MLYFFSLLELGGSGPKVDLTLPIKKEKVCNNMNVHTKMTIKNLFVPLKLFKISKFQCLEFSKSWRSRVSPSAVWKLIPMSGSVYIGFASVGPEDRSHFLTSSAWISRKSPWQWFLYVWPKTKVFANGCAGNFSVQCVEMNS